ncbi:unsaturated rhamnogalacturonyl hydrolase [Paenibacillus endophyticus]|uniref:Unsaturated rhamnogalacturonyl hydrolase n=1 Tax=Paenibacillus endophyticus TaxID=1294268 RepID=A0A7W5C2U3_9BACL|nr:glycoside hydrolase family 88 protein [Paenibacillus endophyticus]MBB3150051.1 unsaturated rhamnogalacturonyl hydrolase [Paenibacillus endophyticus]
MLGILAAVFIGLVMMVILIDILPMSWDWLSRIHIGRYRNKQEWNHSITQVGVNWLNHTPKIKVTDNVRLVAIDMVKGNYSKSAIQHWQEASLLLGLSECMKNGSNKEMDTSIEQFLKSKFDAKGQWRVKPEYIDSAILAYGVLKLDQVDTEHYKLAFDSTWELIQSHIGEDGTVQYRKFMNKYRYVDTIGFVCPFLVRYGIKYNKPECVQLAIRQLEQYEKFGMLEDHFIPSHAYHTDNAMPLGLYGWGRGLGWLAIGLIDSWGELPKEHEFKSSLNQFVLKFARAMLAFQHSDGNWNWTVTRKETRADSSTTATLAWFLLQASQLNELSEECLEGSERAIHYLMKVTRRSGAVDFSQGDTKDIGVYSMLFNILPFTQGFCIRIANFHSREMGR